MAWAVLLDAGNAVALRITDVKGYAHSTSGVHVFPGPSTGDQINTLRLDVLHDGAALLLPSLLFFGHHDLEL